MSGRARELVVDCTPLSAASRKLSLVTKQFRNATRRSDEREPAVLPLELLPQYEQQFEKSGVDC